LKDSDKNKNSLTDKVKNSLIDEFYNEIYQEVDVKLNLNDEALEFKSKLNSTVPRLAELNKDIFDFEIDTLSIIGQGQYIRENRKAKKEFLLFILLSFIILSLYALAIFNIGYKMLIISQIIIVIITLWVGIAALLIKRRGSEV